MVATPDKGTRNDEQSPLEVAPPDIADYSLLALRNKLDRLMDDWFREFGPPFRWRGAGYGPFGRIETEFANRHEVIPRADCIESQKSYVITVELPGMDQDEIDVSMVDDDLIVDGEKVRRTLEQEVAVRLGERRYGRIHRAFRMPDDVDRDNVEASFDAGVLTIVLPKGVNETRPVRHVKVVRP